MIQAKSELAQALAAAVAQVAPDVAFTPAFESPKQAAVTEVLAGGERFGIQPANGNKVIVEFVSANPTGPLHVGHASQAALGSTVCNLLASQGWAVQREFYYNDAGVQIA